MLKRLPNDIPRVFRGLLVEAKRINYRTSITAQKKETKYLFTVLFLTGNL